MPARVRQAFFWAVAWARACAVAAGLSTRLISLSTRVSSSQESSTGMTETELRVERKSSIHSALPHKTWSQITRLLALAASFSRQW